VSSSGVMFVLFVGLMLFALHSTSPGAPAMASIDELSSARNAADNSEPRSNGASSNGNGQPTSDDADDSEPATI